MNNYILDENGNPVLEPDLVKWCRWYQTAKRHVADDKIGDVRVSTVFLGIDHAFVGGEPILWETMVFGGPLDQEQDRYHTREVAVAGHNAMLQRVQEAA